MATTQPSQSPLLNKLQWYIGHKEHSVWDRFSPEEQESLVREDLTASKRVAGVLVSLVTAGLIMSIVALLIVLATG